MTTFTFTTTIERGEASFDAAVSYSVTPYIPQTYWQPQEGGDCEILSITPDTLTEAEEEAVQAECEARAVDDAADAAADYGDYLYEQQRDQRMTDAWEAGQ
jgi:hypothetical protein